MNILAVLLVPRHSACPPGLPPKFLDHLPAAWCELTVSLPPVKPPRETPRPGSAPATASPAGSAVRPSPPQLLDRRSCPGQASWSLLTLCTYAQINASCAESNCPPGILPLRVVTSASLKQSLHPYPAFLLTIMLLAGMF